MTQKMIFLRSSVQGERVSSAPSYDLALSSIFPYFFLTSFENSKEIAAVLAEGWLSTVDNETYLPTSFAIVLNDRGDETGRRVVWLSEASKKVLEQHPDLFCVQQI